MKKNKMNRRNFMKKTAATTVATAALASCTTISKLGAERSPSADSAQLNVDESKKFDFIIVGSGAGGGPLAAGLAKAGYTVLLLEAGSKENNSFSRIPVFHAKASEDPRLNWSYFVERYASEGRYKGYEAMNTKYLQQEQGVYYPRAAGVGGCTRVNALIHLYPDHSDWQHLSMNLDAYHFSAKNMQQVYNNMLKENGGWLNLTQANPLTLVKDEFLLKMALAALSLDGGNALVGADLEIAKKILIEQWNVKLNPNHPGYTSMQGGKKNGLFNIPFNATDGVRQGVREYLLQTENNTQAKLFIKTESLCTRLLFDANDKTKAIGIEYIEGAHVYKADVMNQSQVKSSYVKKVAYAAKEIILSGGAFNTPQLMMLSGIGPAEDLQQKRIPVVKDLPGVGKNLQDRYEVTVVSELNNPISILKDCTFAKDNDFAKDPCWQEYMKDPANHVYGTNGVALSLIRKSSASQSTPDLAIFGLPGKFTGYYPGYSNDTTPKKAGDPSYFTWAILKGHTKNHAGTVTLNSRDPKDPKETPTINFKYFHDKDNGMAEDMTAVLSGLKMVRNINSKIGSKYINSEFYPGEKEQTDDQLRSWIAKEAWGHHASCTCKMGLASDPMAVVDSQFKVHGVQNLRIVDASVFPDIPGLFIMLPTLMMSEKAKELILEQYQKG